jgi:quercetin dioxygenase-like cupin family protein
LVQCPFRTPIHLRAFHHDKRKSTAAGPGLEPADLRHGAGRRRGPEGHADPENRHELERRGDQLSGGQAEITGLLLEIAPGGETGWHKHPVPSFGMVLEGTLEVTLKDGKTRRVNAGEAIAEVVDTWHNGRNVGDTPLKLVVFYAGAADTPLTVRPQ